MKPSVLVVLAFSLPTTALAQPGITRPIEYYNPAWSPDGRRILFESTLTGKFSIYAMNEDGTGLRRLTPDSSNNEQAAWSPDGNRVVFSSDRAGHLDLYVTDPAGTAPVRLTSTPSGGYYGSAFSPDGRWIVFQGRPDNAETRERVYLVPAAGGPIRQLTDTSYSAESPRWSADGQSITFVQVPYPKRFWSELLPADMQAARHGERLVTIGLDGTARPAEPVPERQARARRFADSAGVSDVVISPDGEKAAYVKSVDGFAGLFVYEVVSRRERLLTGGAGAGPVGYLRTATLIPGTDTVDTYTSVPGAKSDAELSKGSGAYVVEARRPLGGRRWELVSTWYDTTGKVTAVQTTRTARGSLATEQEIVRAPTDSASLLIAGDRATGWVVPAGEPPRLIDGVRTEERFEGSLVAMAIAQSKPAIGAVFLAPQGSLFGSDPVAVRIDSIRVVRRDTLYRGAMPISVLVLGRTGGSERWVDESSGVELASHGNAGPNRWWWHIRRGLSLSPR